MPKPETVTPVPKEEAFDIEKFLIIDPADDEFDPNRQPMLMGDLVEPLDGE